jgi:hypothetical protein
MKIAIIGGGWLGCHIATKLKEKNYKVNLFEETDIFSGSSFYNQNRLHRGFHYSRNQKTRKLCYDTFDRFIKDYDGLVDDIENNYYLIPTNNSLIDYGTFKSIFNYENISFIESKLDNFDHIEGSVIVDEKFINPVKAKEYFKDKLKDNIIIRKIYDNEFEQLAEEYDYVINTTNNILNTSKDCYFELSLTLVYDKITKGNFGSITMVDGPLFSIYPFKSTQYTVTDVEYTPLFTSPYIEDINQFKYNVNKKLINPIQQKIENKIKHYYKEFNSVFKFKKYYTSIKVKPYSSSADRYPIITRQDNVINCITGKIQGIYVLEDYINEIINR